MRRYPHLARAALLLLFSAVLTSDATAQPGRVGGLVRNEEGQPIKGATVTAENPDTGVSYTATSDDRGRFIMIGLRPGQWKFTAEAPGYAPEAGVLPVRSTGAPNAPISFGLRRNAPAGSPALGGVAAKDLQTALAAADALFNQQKWDEAVSAYRAIMVRTPALSVINLQIAAAYRNKKDYDGAIAAYNDLLKADSNNEKAKIGIGMTNLERGDMTTAEDTLLAAAGDAAAGREAFYNLGEVKLAKGETAEAVKWYEKARAADPSWGKPLYKLGLCALNQGDKANAATFMDQVIAVDPVSPEAALAKATLDELNK